MFINIGGIFAPFMAVGIRTGGWVTMASTIALSFLLSVISTCVKVLILPAQAMENLQSLATKVSLG